MSGPIRPLLESIADYMFENVNIMITHGKLIRLILTILIMILVQSIMTGIAVIQILKEVR